VTDVVLLRAAQADVRRAARFYERQAANLGVEFAVEVEHAFSRLAEHPEIGSVLSRGARRLLVRRFPYLVIYRALPDRVLVLAVGHQRRHPDFWLRRT
jgi:toxin ParE1/3/4